MPKDNVEKSLDKWTDFLAKIAYTLVFILLVDLSARKIEMYFSNTFKNDIALI